jgi:hypothetical protein|tara:strand:+ start:1768 stop:1986 length:219 start_codon:yes stop_codon:yes gene_type:complete
MTDLDKKKTLEQEAQEFIKTNIEGVPLPLVQLEHYYAGCALSGLLASGKYLQSDDIIDEAYRYSSRMLSKKK